MLSGKITSQVSKDKYTFTDKTGSIVVEIDNEVFAGRQVGPDTQVEIWGKVDKDMFKEPKIDVKRLGIPNQTK
ncbi:YgiW/YdeI family stress tolerance OB fold protein [Oxalobacter formigenes]|uniref:YgiW/YdeI family stress tolerance OB fold protein n=1 Tax=Oxalobacter formigenes TaxID=847 RepID=UPI0022AE644B|nr:NirD/YgiW/YdeI family stress tolerance protein [Oxalobacter formigenes]